VSLHSFFTIDVTLWRHISIVRQVRYFSKCRCWHGYRDIIILRIVVWLFFKYDQTTSLYSLKRNVCHGIVVYIWRHFVTSYLNIMCMPFAGIELVMMPNSLVYTRFCITWGWQCCDHPGAVRHIATSIWSGVAGRLTPRRYYTTMHMLCISRGCFKMIKYNVFQYCITRLQRTTKNIYGTTVWSVDGVYTIIILHWTHVSNIHCTST
jgi:hypothetical protein